MIDQCVVIRSLDPYHLQHLCCVKSLSLFRRKLFGVVVVILSTLDQRQRHGCILGTVLVEI